MTESSKEGCGSRKFVLPLMIMLTIVILNAILLLYVLEYSETKYICRIRLVLLYLSLHYIVFTGDCHCNHPSPDKSRSDRHAFILIHFNIILLLTARCTKLSPPIMNFN
jgi:hypothetical protein